MKTFKTSCLGSVVGMALGDAIGEIAYRFPRRVHLLAQVDQSDMLRYTGDTAMALALAESLIEVGDVDTQHMGLAFKKHYLEESDRCFGPGLPKIFDLVETNHISFPEAAKKMYNGQGSLGNGAAMRVAPLGLVYHGSRDLYQKAHQSASVTHIHPLGTDGAAVMAKAIALCVKADPESSFSAFDFCHKLAEFSQTPEISGKMLRVADLVDSDELPMKAAQQLGRSITVHESLPFALYCFLKSHNDFVESIVTAVCNGGDSNTLGAMTGALSGAFLGIGGIPATWKQKIENLDLLDKLAVGLEQASHPELV